MFVSLSLQACVVLLLFEFIFQLANILVHYRPLLVYVFALYNASDRHHLRGKNILLTIPTPTYYEPGTTTLTNLGTTVVLEVKILGYVILETLDMHSMSI